MNTITEYTRKNLLSFIDEACDSEASWTCSMPAGDLIFHGFDNTSGFNALPTDVRVSLVEELSRIEEDVVERAEAIGFGEFPSPIVGGKYCYGWKGRGNPDLPVSCTEAWEALAKLADADATINAELVKIFG